MQKFKFEVTMKVADSWVADGFQVKDRLEQIAETLSGLLPYAHGHECVIEVKEISSPKASVITSLQNGELEVKD